MNDRKLKQLFDAARHAPAPDAPPNFAEGALAAIRHERREAPADFWEQLAALLPRITVAAALILAACLMADAGFSRATGGNFSEDIHQISEQWLFAVEN